MHEQRELPGGALGDAITTLNTNERHWLRPATIGHDADPELKHTTVRWHTADPTAPEMNSRTANNFTDAMRAILSVSPKRAAEIRAQTSGRAAGGGATERPVPAGGPDPSTSDT